MASLLRRKQVGGGGSGRGCSDDKAAALGVYAEGVGRYERLAAAQLLNRTQRSAVLSHYSERLMQEPGLQGHRPAMELAGALVTKAVEADPAGDNLKARLAHAMFVLATAATPAEQRAALRVAGRVEPWAIKSFRTDFNLNVLVDTYDYSCF
jgi:hypothetical protein